MAKRRNSLSLTLLLCVMGLITVSVSPGRCQMAEAGELRTSHCSYGYYCRGPEGVRRAERVWNPLLVFPEEHTGDFTRNHPAHPPPPNSSSAGPSLCCILLRGHQTTRPPASPHPAFPQIHPDGIYLFFCIYFPHQFISFLKYTAEPQADPAPQASQQDGHPTREDPRKPPNQNQTWNQSSL